MLVWALLLGGCIGTRATRAEPNATAERAAANPNPSASARFSAMAPKTSEAGGPSAGVAVTPVEKPEDTAPPSARTLAVAEMPVLDEPLYFPGARARPKGSAVEVSLDDEIVATWNRGGLSAEPGQGPKGKPVHAAPRVKVDVIDVRGDVNEADMLRAARLKSYWPFRICFEQGLRRMQKLHGTIKLRLTLGPNGRPSGIQQLTTELSDPAVVSCVVKSAMGLGLPAPSSGAPQITLDISLWPGDEPVSVKSAMRGNDAAPAESKAMIDQLRTHWSDVRNCYAAGLGRHEGLWGRLALALHVTGGVVDDVNEVESHFPDTEVTACVRKVFLRATVPSTDRELTVVYPLRLGRAPDGRETRR
jgi:hypothetical protein